MDLVTPDIGLIFWTTISFAILYFILAKFAWKPILGAVTEREKSIKDALSAAEKAKEAGVVAPLSFGWQSWSVIENYSTWHNIPVGSKENGFAGLDTELTFNNAAVVNNIQRIADMGKKGLFKYGGRRGDSRAMFVNGECIFWINSSAYYLSLIHI